MNFEPLTKNTVLKYRESLAHYYYNNSITCSAAFDSNYNQAEQKIMELANYLSENKAVSYGAFEEGKLVGYVWAYEHVFRDERRMYVSELHVQEQYRGNRIGHTLLKLVEEEAKKRHLPSLYIHTEASNKGAWRLYEREGFILERIQLCKSLDVED